MRGFILSCSLLLLLQMCSARDAVWRSADAPRIEVIHCRIAPSNEFVDVRFRISGTGSFEPDRADTYLVDEATGEKYYVMLLQRVGRLTEIRDRDATAAHSILFRNLDRKLRPGSRVAVVVGGMRQDHVLVER